MIPPPFLVVSAELRDVGAVLNAERSASLFERIVELGLSPITVDYMGGPVPVESFIVPVEDGAPAYRELLEALWGLYEQESALYVSPTGRAFLDRPGEPTELLGRWTEVNPFEESIRGYISDPDGRYWAVRP